MSLVLGWLVWMVPQVVYVLILAGFTRVARGLQLPVVASTALVGAVFGTVWQWFWMESDQYAAFALNLIPSLLVYELGLRYPLRYPHVLADSIIVSGVLWGVVGLIVGMVAARRWACTSQTDPGPPH